tara:strand:- start:318 stop:521 length:204 start_codon:yes stop_codon:yes gene_type:complete
LPGEHLPGERVPLSSYLNLSVSCFLAVHNEIAYRWSQEVAAMGKLSQEELEMVYKIGFKPTDYLAHK